MDRGDSVRMDVIPNAADKQLFGSCAVRRFEPWAGFVPEGNAHDLRIRTVY